MNHYLNQGKRSKSQEIINKNLFSDWQLNVNCISKIWVLKLVGQQFSWPNMLGHFLSFFYFIFDHRSFTVKMPINKENLVRFLYLYFSHFIKYFSCGSSMLMSYFSLRKTNSRNYFRSSFQSFYNAINQLIQKLFLLLVSYNNPDKSRNNRVSGASQLILLIM